MNTKILRIFIVMILALVLTQPVYAQPAESTDQNQVVQGPSGKTVSRCVIFLEPIQPGETQSKASEPVCSTGKIDSVNGYSLAATYTIAKFYDYTNWNTLLVTYVGASPCSSTVSYGRTSLPSNLDNKFASGSGYSSCSHIYVYSLPNYGGASISCYSCATFDVLIDLVSSWRVTYN